MSGTSAEFEKIDQDNKICLKEPDHRLRDEYLQMILEFRQNGESISFHDTAIEDFSGYLEMVHQFAAGINLHEGLVPMSCHWMILNDQIILGESRLRHKLNPELEIEGGNIGYAIRPFQRRMGYGTKILALTLEKARQLGLKEVLVTCDTDNVASTRVIEKNDGKFSGFTVSPDRAKQISQYRINIG